VLENTALRKKVQEGWRKLRNKELGGLYSSTNTITAITSRKMRWAGHVTGTEENRNAHRGLTGKPKMEEITWKAWVDWRIILKRSLNKRDGKEQAGSGAGQGHVAGCCEHGNESSDSIRCEKIVDHLLKSTTPFHVVKHATLQHACVRKDKVP
jgi:hypothetical protein